MHSFSYAKMKIVQDMSYFVTIEAVNKHYSITTEFCSEIIYSYKFQGFPALEALITRSHMSVCFDYEKICCFTQELKTHARIKCRRRTFDY